MAVKLIKYDLRKSEPVGLASLDEIRLSFSLIAFPELPVLYKRGPVVGNILATTRA